MILNFVFHEVEKSTSYHKPSSATESTDDSGPISSIISTFRASDIIAQLYTQDPISNFVGKAVFITPNFVVSKLRWDRFSPTYYRIHNNNMISEICPI